MRIEGRRAARSTRWPQPPDLRRRPERGSWKKQGSVLVNSLAAFDQWKPPSVEVNMVCERWVGSPLNSGFSNCSANRYATPRLSVRIVHPDDPNPPWP